MKSEDRNCPKAGARLMNENIILKIRLQPLAITFPLRFISFSRLAVRRLQVMY